MEAVQGMVGTKSVLDGILTLLALPLKPKQPGGACIRQIRADFKPRIPQLRKDTAKLDIIAQVLEHQLTVYDGVRKFDLLVVDPTRLRPVLQETKDLVKEAQQKLKTLKEQADHLQSFNDALRAEGQDLKTARGVVDSELQSEVAKAGMAVHLADTKRRELAALEEVISNKREVLQGLSSRLSKDSGSLRGRENKRRRSTGNITTRVRHSSNRV
jgi:chromosome segregation ATPase